MAPIVLAIVAVALGAALVWRWRAAVAVAERDPLDDEPTGPIRYRAEIEAEAARRAERSADYALLRVDPGCTDDELKAAYRRWAARVHPDKVAGKPPEVVEEARRTFEELREAYDRIRAERGLG